MHRQHDIAWSVSEWRYSRLIQSNSSAIEPNRTPIVRLPNSMEHNRTHNKILPIEHNRTLDYRTIGNRTQSNVRLPKDWLTKLSSADIIAVTLATALLVSTSLLATLENLERVMAAARSLLLIIILILNTTCLCCCCWNGAIFLCWEAFPFNSHSTLTVIEIAFYLFCFVRTLTFLQYDVQFLFIQ